MGATGGVPRGIRKPSHVAYYVALGGIVTLLVLLCLYFCCYFINKVKELSTSETLMTAPTTSCRPPASTAYPVQPVVRESASAMAKICKQVPASNTHTVFPTSTSPAALHTDVGTPDTEVPDTQEAPGRPADDAEEVREPDRAGKVVHPSVVVTSEVTAGN